MTITNPVPEDKAREAYRKSSDQIPFPQATREFAEKTIDQTREAYGRSNRTLEAAVRTVEKSIDATCQSAAALRRNIIDIAHRNLILSFGLAKTLAGASNLSELAKLQATYWLKQFDAFTTQAYEAQNRLIGLYAPAPPPLEYPSVTRPPRRHLLMLKRRRIRSIAPQREIAPRDKDATRRNLGNHQLLRRPFVRLMKDNPRPKKGCSGRRAYSAKPSGRKIANQSGGHAQPHIAEPTKRIATMINAVVMVGSHPHRAAIWT